MVGVSAAVAGAGWGGVSSATLGFVSSTAGAVGVSGSVGFAAGLFPATGGDGGGVSRTGGGGAGGIDDGGCVLGAGCEGTCTCDVSSPGVSLWAVTGSSAASAGIVACGSFDGGSPVVIATAVAEPMEDDETGVGSGDADRVVIRCGRGDLTRHGLVYVECDVA